MAANQRIKGFPCKISSQEGHLSSKNQGFVDPLLVQLSKLPNGGKLAFFQINKLWLHTGFGWGASVSICFENIALWDKYQYNCFCSNLKMIQHVVPCYIMEKKHTHCFEHIKSCWVIWCVCLTAQNQGESHCTGGRRLKSWGVTK